MRRSAPVRAALAALAVVGASCASGPQAPSKAALPASASLPASLPASQAASPAAQPTSPGSAAPPVRGGALPNFSHVVVIMLENHEATAILGNPAAPYLNGLASQGAVATRYFAISHPSLPNYLAVVGGSTFGISTDCSPGPQCRAPDPSLPDQLNSAGISWKAYLEDMPGNCDQVASGTYAVKHDPFVYFPGVVSAQCSQVVPARALSEDLATGNLPRFAWLSPNLCHDMHDCPVSAGDAYLAGIVPTLLGALGPSGVLLITFDEGTTNNGGGQPGAAGGQVAMIAAGPGARAGARSAQPYDHYSLLRTIEEAWGLPILRSAAGAAPMTDLFAGPAG